jgi:hypothetical protein
MDTVDKPQYPIDISVALEASAIVKAGKGVLHRVTVTNTNASAQYIQVHNSATVPADTAVPFDIFTVPASSTYVYEWEGGLVCSSGIVVCNSSTAPTKTIGSADCWFSVRYE